MIKPNIYKALDQIEDLANNNMPYDHFIILHHDDSKERNDVMSGLETSELDEVKVLLGVHNKKLHSSSESLKIFRSKTNIPTIEYVEYYCLFSGIEIRLEYIHNEKTFGRKIVVDIIGENA